MAKNRQKRASFGFSTIELLIIIVVIIILGSLIFVTYKGVQQRNRDTDRKGDIIKIEGQIEAYQAETNKYPSVKQMNDPGFRAANMKELQGTNLTDPLWKPTNKFCSGSGNIMQDSVAPAIGCYGYDPSPAGCNNATIDCTSFVLTANLETGGTYSKQSIN